MYLISNDNNNTRRRSCLLVKLTHVWTMSALAEVSGKPSSAWFHTFRGISQHWLNQKTSVRIPVKLNKASGINRRCLNSRWPGPCWLGMPRLYQQNHGTGQASCGVRSYLFNNILFNLVCSIYHRKNAIINDLKNLLHNGFLLSSVNINSFLSTENKQKQKIVRHDVRVGKYWQQ